MERLRGVASAAYLGLAAISGIREMERGRRMEIIGNSARGIIARSACSQG